MPFWLPVCNYSHSVSWLSVFWQSHPYPVMSACSKNVKLGPSPEAASAQLPERARLLLARCLILLNDIDGAYYYEAIGTVSIPGSLSHQLCVTDEQLVTIYRYCGFYNVKRNCFYDTILFKALLNYQNLINIPVAQAPTFCTVVRSLPLTQPQHKALLLKSARLVGVSIMTGVPGSAYQQVLWM
jgi:hypothetical protein